MSAADYLMPLSWNTSNLFSLIPSVLFQSARVSLRGTVLYSMCHLRFPKLNATVVNSLNIKNIPFQYIVLIALKEIMRWVTQSKTNIYICENLMLCSLISAQQGD